MPNSRYLNKKYQDHLFVQGGSIWTPPSHLWVALSSTDPLQDGSGITEPTGVGSYARVSTTPGTDWGATTVGTGQAVNLNQVTFPKCTSDWGTMLFFAIFDASTSGNMLGSGALTTPQIIKTNNTPDFDAGSLSITTT